MAIAKIFVIDNEQIVVMKNNEPALDLHFEQDDMVVTLTLNFADTDEGWDNRDKAFDLMKEDQLLNIRESLWIDLDEIEN